MSDYPHALRHELLVALVTTGDEYVERLGIGEIDFLVGPNYLDVRRDRRDLLDRVEHKRG